MRAPHPGSGPRAPPCDAPQRETLEDKAAAELRARKKAKKEAEKEMAMLLGAEVAIKKKKKKKKAEGEVRSPSTGLLQTLLTREAGQVRRVGLAAPLRRGVVSAALPNGWQVAQRPRPSGTNFR